MSTSRERTGLEPQDLTNWKTEQKTDMGFVAGKKSSTSVTLPSPPHQVADQLEQLYAKRTLTGGNGILVGGRETDLPAITGVSKSTKLIKFHTGQLQNAASPTFDTHTWHQTMGCDAHFDAIQIIIQHDQASGYTLGGAAVGVSANITDNVTPTGGWNNVTFGGSATAAIPARVAAGVPSITVSDVINISSLAPTDGAWPYLMIRTYCAAGGYSVSGLSVVMSQQAQTQGRYFASYRDGTGNYATTAQASFTKGSAQSLIHVTGVVFYCRGRVVSVVGIGDSITQGAGVTGESQNGFGPRAYGAVSTLSAPVVWSNFGYASQPVETYFQRFEALIAAGLKPHVAVFAPFSPNGGAPNQTRTNIVRSRLSRFLALCDENRIIPILWTGAPNTAAAWDATADNFRKALNAELLALRGQGRIVLDFASALGDGATPERFAGGMSEDGTHPGAGGYNAMAGLFAPVLSRIQQAVFG